MFSIVMNSSEIPKEVKEHVYLISDFWDDWFAFRTMFTVIIFDSKGNQYQPGSIKIGEVGLRERGATGTIERGFRTPTLPPSFTSLDTSNFSLGQGDNFYETLNEIEPSFRKAILTGLRDCAFDLSIFTANKNEPVMQQSLLRYISEENVRNRLNRLAHGNAELTNFEFEYVLPTNTESTETPPILGFSVKPNSEPPSNVHVLIGRNGVGKTRCLQSLTKAILGSMGSDQSCGELHQLGFNKDKWSFAGLVLVSFSIFDDFDLPESDPSVVRSTLVGLRYKKTIREAESDAETVVTQVKTPSMLADDFVNSLEVCRVGLRSERWRAAVGTLEVDPLFAEANVTQLLDLPETEWKSIAQKLFSKLSSGHAIVLLTITRLVELVDERTLVILDEPEGHLHPPLLSAFIRSVADLLIKRNGLALIATHSPVVLQEVPRSCAWKLRRSGTVATAERPTIETFGENVGVLTREVFGFEVTKAGFHNLLRSSIENSNASYESVLAHFSNQLGVEARAHVRGLLANRATHSSDNDENLT
ncbi:MAG: ATP-binding protein [Gammaproteobacteria bacterium]|nr:ATP-binding protein [Gammaproteobacteria bacterium]MBU1776669.1 ATP-binding protein [Gammaproteobacteria bacterium]MBU1968516.1 ATP-binding protein [Gammaproteobacteria bacterium]